ncbi:MAG: DNA gyrase subunit A [Nocardioidaceae bacterium]
MEESFGVNAVALVDGQPRTLGLKELLEVFLAHRFDVVRRRTEFRRRKAAEQLHLVDGLPHRHPRHRRGDPADPRERRHRRGTCAVDRGLRPQSEIQANDILEMPLRRLTRFSRLDLEREAEELRQQIEGYEAVLGGRGAAAYRRAPTSWTRSPRASARHGGPCCWSRPGRR